MKLHSLLAVGIILISSFCFAEEGEFIDSFSLNEVGKTDLALKLGAGVIVPNRAYKDLDDDTFVIPFIDLQYGDFYFKGIQTGYRIYNCDMWDAYLVGEFRMGVYDDENGYLDGMKDRDTTFDGGMALTYKHPWANLTLTYLTDLFSKHQGQELRLTANKRYQYCDLTLVPVVGVSYFNSNFNDYYYGVRSSEARVNRPAYSVGDATTWFTGMNVDYKLDDKWSVFGLFRYEWLPSEITGSPVINKDYSTVLAAGLLYKF